MVLHTSAPKFPVTKIPTGPKDPVRAAPEITANAALKIPDAADLQPAEVSEVRVTGTTEVTRQSYTGPRASCPSLKVPAIATL